MAITDFTAGEFSIVSPKFPPHHAWNNFVMLSDPASYSPDSIFREAAIVNRFWGSVNNGGLNSFLTGSYDLDADEVRNALERFGAQMAARQLEAVIAGIGEPLNKSLQDERWDILDKYWPDYLDDIDYLSQESENELIAASEMHVQQNEEYYLLLSNSEN